MITKKWQDSCTEMCTDFSHFTVSFPAEIDVEMKATLIAAVLLIDYMHFQHKKNGNGND